MKKTYYRLVLAAVALFAVGCGPQTQKNTPEDTDDTVQVIDTMANAEVPQIVEQTEDNALANIEKTDSAKAAVKPNSLNAKDSTTLSSFANAPSGSASTGAHGGKVVYLTFDDGPSPNTAKVLDILKANGVHATFFVTGSHQNNASLIHRAYAEGHAIGAHTYTHNYNIYTSMTTYFNDLEKIEQLIEQQTGHRTPIIRFPGGSSNTVHRKYNSDPNFMVKLTDAVRAKGYQYVDWNLSNGDASGGRVAASTLIKNACVAKNGNICLLMHDTYGKETTVQALPEIIRFFKSHGYEFGRLTDTSYVCHHGIGGRKATTSPAPKGGSTSTPKDTTKTKKPATTTPVEEPKEETPVVEPAPAPVETPAEPVSE